MLEYGISLSASGNNGISQSEHGSCTRVAWGMILSGVPTDNTNNGSKEAKGTYLDQPGTTGITDANKTGMEQRLSGPYVKPYSDSEEERENHWYCWSAFLDCLSLVFP